MMRRFMNVSASVGANSPHSTPVRRQAMNSNKLKTTPEMTRPLLGRKDRLPGQSSSREHDVTEPSKRASTDLLPNLSADEQEFFSLVAMGEVKAVEDFLSVYVNFNINCQNYQGETALVVAVHGDDVPMVELLLQFDTLVVGDALLHAAGTGNCQILQLLIHRFGVDPNEELTSGLCASAEFSADLTPLHVAAHNEHFQAIELLLQQGYTITKPHPPYCFCKEQCQKRKLGESLCNSKARYNTYRALASPSYICHSSVDPILTAFNLSTELLICAKAEPEFKTEYELLSEQCSEFAVALLDQCRNTQEVHTILNRREGGENLSNSQRIKFPRVAVAVHTQQKAFVAHCNCQQVLRGVWLEGWQDWRKLGFMTKVCLTVQPYSSTVYHLMALLPRAFMLPFMALLYLVAPNSRHVRSWRSPVNKFFNLAASYIVFLVLLFIQNSIDNMTSERGPPTTGLEYFVMLYVAGFGWYTIKQAWICGLRQYANHKWNLYDLALVCTFTAAFICWALAALDVARNDHVFLPRMYWDQYDPTLIGEAFYAVATILAFGKLIYFFQIGNSLGPLQISMSRMFTDIANFLVVFMVILLSFAVGLNKLYHHYAGQVRNLGGVEVRQSDAFETLTRAVETLYWAVYGYSPPYYADVVVSEYYIKEGNQTKTISNYHHFTEKVGHTIFAIFYITGIIILVNMLIAMMSTSFSNVQSNADMEWKFARVKVWLSFFEDGGTLPPPFNLIPSPKTFIFCCRWFVHAIMGNRRAHCSFQKCFYYDEPVDEFLDDDKCYELLMSRLVQRYLTSRQQIRYSAPLTNRELEPVQQQLKELRQLVTLLLDQQSPTHSQLSLDPTHSHV